MEAMLIKKNTHKVTCRNDTEENKNRCVSMKNKAKKFLSKATREKAEEGLTVLKIVPMECSDQ